jgi:hypothetical protein
MNKKNKKVPTTEEIRNFLRNNGPSDMFTIAKHFNCLTKPVPDDKIRIAVWTAVGKKIDVKNFNFYYTNTPIIDYP